MVLVTAAMLGLLWWSASCHNVRGYSVAKADRVIAATVFWGTLFMPILAGLVLSINAVNKNVQSQWPVFEFLIIGFLLIANFGSHTVGRLYGKILPNEAVATPVTYILVVVSIGVSVLNVRLGIRDMKWIRTALSVLIAIGGTALILVGNAWAIYLE